VANRRVELAGKADRRFVGDFELHRNHRGDALLHETLRGAGKRIGARGARPFARVQHGEAQRPMVVEQRADELSADATAAFLRILENQHTILLLFVEAAVSDEVEDVVLPLTQAALQLGQRRVLLPLDLDQPALFEIRQRFVHLGRLAFHVELREVGRARDHHQHAQRRRHGERADALGQFEVAHDRRLDREAEEAVHARVVEKLPGQVSERRGLPQMQPHAQADALTIRLVEAAAQAAADVAGEDLVEQASTKELRRYHLGRFDPPHRVAGAADAQQEVFYFEIGERCGEVGRRLAAGRVEHSRAEAVTNRFDDEIEVEIFHEGARSAA
jgi:hypothetical protein